MRPLNRLRQVLQSSGYGRVGLTSVRLDILGDNRSEHQKHQEHIRIIMFVSMAKTLQAPARVEFTDNDFSQTQTCRMLSGYSFAVNAVQRVAYYIRL